MALGYSHPVAFKLPKGVTAKVDKNRVDALQRRPRPGRPDGGQGPRASSPEPYKGKGVKYVEEVIKRKVGKAGATAAGAAASAATF